MKNPLLLFFLLIICAFTYAQEPFKLNYQHNGNYDFTMIGATLNSQPNNISCDLNLPPGETASAQLSLAADQTIIAAYLYWSSYNAGTVDKAVSLNGNLVFRDSEYQAVIGGNQFYSCTADVTDLVQTSGEIEYTLTDLDIVRGTNCSISYGGWAMVVVYEDPDLVKNSVNIYEGFMGVSGDQGSNVIIDIYNLLIVNDTGSSLGLLAWEGDADLAVQERVQFNGNLLSNAINPQNNVFNGTNSYTNDTELHNMDLDGFDIDDYVEIGDEEATIEISSGQDLAIMNVVAFTLNNELPDPSLQIDNLAAPNCDDTQVAIDFTVLNVNANDVLPAGASVKFYIETTDSAPVAEEFTTTEIPIGGSESLSTTFNIPPGTPDDFTIIGTVNLDENEETIFLELNPNNNTVSQDFSAPQDYNVEDEAAICDNESFELIDGTIVEDPGTYTATVPAMNGCDSTVVLTLIVNPIPNAQPAELIECSDNNQASFELSDAEEQFNNGNDYSYAFYETQTDAENEENEIPSTYNATNGSTTVYVRTENEFACYNVTPIELTIVPNPTIGALTDEIACDDDGDQSVIFDLTTKNAQVLDGADPNDFSIWYFENETDAQNGNTANAITDPANYTTANNPQEIFVMLESELSGNCFSSSSFLIEIFQGPEAVDLPVTVANCSQGNTAFFNLSNFALQVANGDNTMQVDFYPTVADAENGTNIINTPNNYESPTATIAGLVTNPTTGCTSIGLVELTVIPEPLVSDQSMAACATNDANSTAIFDIEQFTEDIIGGVENISVTYHESLTDAESGNQPIADPQNFESPSQTVYARSETTSDGTTCYSISEIEITVNTRPVVNNISYYLCSDTDEQAFDLESQNEIIISNSENYTIQYYSSEALAEAGGSDGEISSPFTSANTTIFVRTVDNTTNCVSISEMELIVEQNPQISEEELTFSECQQGGMANFDLNAYLSIFENDYPDFDFTFYGDTMAAENEDAGGQLTEVETNSDQTVFLRINSTINNCYTIEEVLLDVEDIPLLDEGNVIICLNHGYTLPNGEQVFEPGLYERFITDRETNCDIRTRTNLILGDIMFPNAFGPNANNANDTFRPVPGKECVGDVTNYQLKIFNRWGELVYSTTNFSEGWNGQLQGLPAQSGIYIYHATYTFQGENREQNGTVNLIR